MSSAAIWEALWTEAIIEMRLTEEQFFALTPRLFYALRKRHKRVLEHTELLHAMTTSVLYNKNMMGTPQKAAKPDDFMPTRLAKAVEKAPRPKRWTRKGFASNLIAARQHMTGWFVVKPATPKENTEE